MEGHEEGFISGGIAGFVRSWSLRRAKLTFIISTPLYTGSVLYAHFFHWPVSLAEGISFIAGASTMTSVIAFFSRHTPEFEF
jgi:hypothetical protein